MKQPEDQLWVVVPAYNEEAIISQVLKELCATFKNVVVVDDCSTDGTLCAVRQEAVHVLSHPFNMGQGAAIQTGIEYALNFEAKYIATFDADGQHDPSDLLSMWDKLKLTHAEVALGSRFLGTTTGITYTRIALLKLAIIYSNFSTGLKLTDTHNGIRVIKHTFLKNFSFKQNKMAHASEILEFISKHRISYIECPVSIRYTDYSIRKGQSSINAVRIVIETLFGRVR